MQAALEDAGIAPQAIGHINAHVTGRAVPFGGEYALTNSFGFGGQKAALVRFYRSKYES